MTGDIPCRACGNPVDPLRAGAVGIFDTGVAYFCSTTCKEEFGRRPSEAPRARPVVAPSMPPPPAAVVPVAAAATAPAASLPGASPRASFASTAPTALVSGAARRISWGLVAIGLAGALAPILPLAIRHARAAATVQAALLAALTGSFVWTIVQALERRRRSAGAVVASLLTAGAAIVLGGLGLHALARGEMRAAHATLAFAASALAILWIGETAAERIRQVVRRALDARVVAPPPEAIVLRGGRPTPVAPTAVRPGEELIVHAGEVLAVDGVVRAVVGPDGSGPGRAFCVSPLQTGQANQASKMRPLVEGDAILAGTRLGSGEVRVIASVAGDQSALTRVLGTERASAWASTIVGRAANRILWWGPAVLFVSAIAVAFSLVERPLSFTAIAIAVASLLFAAAPRAVRRIVPAALRAASLSALRRGILYRDLGALEAAGRAGIATFISRGVVTSGEPSVDAVAGVGDRDEREVIAIAGGAEKAAATHPVGRAIARYAEERAAPLVPVRRATETPGRGVVATSSGGEPVVIGTRQHLLAEGVSVAAAEAKAAAFEERGFSAVFVAIGGKTQAVVGVHDAVRATAAEATRRLRSNGIEPALLGGDGRGVLEALGREIDVDHVRAEVEPGMRADEIRRLGEAGTLVAVVGRPVADGPSLGAANVAVALGGAGRPEPYAVALAGDDLRDAAAALTIPRAALRVVRRSLWLASGLTATAALLAACQIIPPPAVAAILAATEVWVEWRAAQIAIGPPPSGPIGNRLAPERAG